MLTKKKMDKIIRHFKVRRGEREIIYPFTTFSCVLEAEKTPESVNRTLQLYLKNVFLNGVPANLEKTVTELPQLIMDIEKRECELITLAAAASYAGMKNQQHECVQNYFLLQDPHTIATEIPVWDDITLGHIDLIRVLEGKIQVADFKPNAHKETKAASQVLRYISLLAKQLNLPMRLFEGVYFDAKNAYFLKI